MNDTATLQKLLKLLKEDARLSQIIADMEVALPQLEEEKREFIRNGDLSDDAQFRRVGDIGLRLELIKNRLPSARDAQAQGWGAIHQAIMPVRSQFASLVHDRLEKMKEGIRAALKPHITDPSMLEKAVESADAVQQLAAKFQTVAGDYCPTENPSQMPIAARRLIADLDAFQKS